MKNYLFTGFPGFIARSLVKGIMESPHHRPDHIYLLVLQSQRENAEREIQILQSACPAFKDRIHLIEGNITLPDLGMNTAVSEELMPTIRYVYHLAALYDLAAQQDAAYKVNVDGTRHVTKWAEKCQNLNRYTYFSTAYVSGKREGLITEDELDMGQAFKNHYEKTKFEAEKIVQAAKKRIPVTIIRPGIVRGRSDNGETIKFDGPYFILNMFDRLSFLPLIPYLGTGKADGNFVPVDYVIQATVYLSRTSAGAGKTYHLTDPSPLPMREVYRLLMEEYLGKKPRGTIPLGSATFFLRFRKLRRWLGVEQEALAYLTCRTVYDTTKTEKDLADSGIHISSFEDTLTSMVRFYKTHKSDPDRKIHIN
ncbi:3-beta hydroxysteroid dehydrogenase [Alteribacter lacisalsi]|uniref:3-beta hydroxysteroid dehydrogenase n=1 Tax=Alteribacter lacisalsi TaxID=2045244 RepID=A0A2W0HMK8_9BACI|nr:SDR family oxidoreductase [Alteribacter lacisalsi]PYZ98312.1 3-beta hydroxysteroid dehydrogenase [Alteribacter lacisalsi]